MTRQRLEERVTFYCTFGSNHGKPTIGSKADLENRTDRSPGRPSSQHYQPDNAVPVVAGKMDGIQGPRKRNQHSARRRVPRAEAQPTCHQ